MLLISELKLSLNDDESLLEEEIRRRIKLNNKTCFKYSIYKKSLDARKEKVYKYQVLVDIGNETKYLKYKNVSIYKKVNTSVNKVITTIRPIVIGYGPSGIFATYRLIEAGLKPIIIEKGKRIDDRAKDVERFFKEGILDENSNIQFGEGGAGTFSDAKLTTRIKDPFINYILDVFIKFGAKESIKITPHAHIGTDEIREIIKRITNYLIENGAEFHFEEELEELLIEHKTITGVKTNKGSYNSPIVLLGIGHSSSETIKKIYAQGITITAKDIAIGFRVEHPQSLIDFNQLGTNKVKEPSEYFLRYKDEKGVYSFCMCPGGLVVPATSNKGQVVTNGMSYAARDSGVANSAILIQVNTSEFNNGVLGGFEYLKEYEQKAFNVSSSYKALASNIKDYLNNTSHDLIFKSTYSLGTINYNFNNFFKQKDNEIFKRALKDFDKKIPGFIDSGIMVGPETRSSCPIRINRDINGQSLSTTGLFPMGEGAGYGGGIMSCSLDGIRSANKVLEFISNSSH